jgi:hypothetical protein
VLMPMAPCFCVLAARDELFRMLNEDELRDSILLVRHTPSRLFPYRLLVACCSTLSALIFRLRWRTFDGDVCWCDG